MTALMVGAAFIVGGTLGALGMAVVAAGARYTEAVSFIFDWEGPEAVFLDTIDRHDMGVGVGEWSRGEDGYWALTVDVAEWEVRR